jgi:hypothetical protein
MNHFENWNLLQLLKYQVQVKHSLNIHAFDDLSVDLACFELIGECGRSVDIQVFGQQVEILENPGHIAEHIVGWH